VLKCLVGEKQVLPVLHVGERIISQCVLLVSWRQVNAQTMTPPKYAGFNFDQGKEVTSRITEEVGIYCAGMLRSYDQKIVRPDRPMQAAVLNQTGLEINEWPLCLDFKGCRVSVAAHCHRINIMFPIQVSTKNQRPCSRWVTNANFSFEAVSGSLRHSVVVCVPFTGTRLL